MFNQLMCDYSCWMEDKPHAEQVYMLTKCVHVLDLVLSRLLLSC